MTQLQDPIGFQESVVALIPRLRRFTVAVTGNLPDGDDLLQSTIERALMRRETYKPDKKLQSWLFKIAQNIWIDQKRSEARRGQMEDIADRTDIVGEDGREKMEKMEMTKNIMAVATGRERVDRLFSDRMKCSNY
ncbi:MAG: RNA polymerase sigma factor [Kordiimonadaceae bacterium]|nr:RNA polymerase sigma factor [Kordiimonadaceae bacterium]